MCMRVRAGPLSGGGGAAWARLACRSHGPPTLSGSLEASGTHDFPGSGGGRSRRCQGTRVERPPGWAPCRAGDSRGARVRLLSSAHGAAPCSLSLRNVFSVESWGPCGPTVVLSLTGCRGADPAGCPEGHGRWRAGQLSLPGTQHTHRGSRSASRPSRKTVRSLSPAGMLARWASSWACAPSSSSMGQQGTQTGV